MEDVMTEIVKDQVQFKPNLNLEVKKLIKKILVIDPNRRPSAIEILNDKLFENFEKIEFEIPNKIKRENKLSSKKETK